MTGIHRHVLVWDTAVVDTHSNIIQGLQAGQASFDARSHDTEYKHAKSTHVAPTPETQFQVSGQTAMHTGMEIHFTQP